MIFNKLAEDVLNDRYFKSLLNKLIENYFEAVLKNDFEEHSLTMKDLSSLSRFADILSNSEYSNHRNLSLKIISNLYNFFKEEEYFQIYLKAILARLGNFPAFGLLETKNELPLDRELELIYKMENQRIDNASEKIYTDIQFDIIEKVKNNNFYSFSGPTSFGKTYIIKSLIKHKIINNEKNNIVLVVPTKALINEIVLDLNEEFKSFSELNDIKVFSNFTTRKYRSKNNVFVLTPERLLAMLNEDECPIINNLLIDEAHKLGVENDQRSITFFLAIEKTLLKFNGINLYFSAPLINNPNVLLDLFKIDSSNRTFNTEESPVDQNLMFIDLIDNKKKIFHPVKKQFIEHDLGPISSTTEEIIFEIGDGHSNVIYSSSINEAVNSAMELKRKLEENNNKFSINSNSEINNLIELVKETLHADFYLIECLEYGIAFHYGGLPQAIRLKIEELFKLNQITYLFCTSTLLEGINLPARNLFVLQNKKGRANMEIIDFWNLAGRAGRLTYELSGNVICLKSKNNQWNSEKVLDKSIIDLKPVVTKKISRNSKKILNVITNKSRRSNTTDYKVIEYIGNVIAIDNLNNENSLLLNEVKTTIKDEINLYFKQFEIKVPYEILKTSYSIHLLQQNNAFIDLTKNNGEKFLVKQINYKNCLALLKHLYSIYHWEIYENKLQNEEMLKYYAVLMNQWMNGVSIKKIIETSIEYQVKNEKTVYKNGVNTNELFNRGNKEHINDLITSTLNNLEQIIQFKLQYYIENFINIIEYLSENEVVDNWGEYLEFGTTNPVEIGLQNLGLSRQTAKFLVENFSELIEYKDELLIINKDELLKNIKGSIFEIEIKNILTLY